MPAYELIPEWDGSIIFASRGCIRKCPYCAVPIIEGEICNLKYSIKNLIYPGHTNIIFWDNNILSAPNWRPIFDELIDLQKKVDFNQGLDARLITDEVSKKLAKIKIPIIRIAYDQRNIGKFVFRAIERMAAAGINKRKILCYVMYNFNDDPEDFLERVRDLLNWGVVAYPMRYQPILELPYALEKNSYIAPKWNKKQLEIVARLRRVVGCVGTFPPYRALVERVNQVKSLEELLYPEKKVRVGSKNDILLATPRIIAKQRPRWNGDPDWLRNLKSRKSPNGSH